MSGGSAGSMTEEALPVMAAMMPPELTETEKGGHIVSRHHRTIAHHRIPKDSGTVLVCTRTTGEQYATALN